MKRSLVALPVAALLIGLGVAAPAGPAGSSTVKRPDCQDNAAICAEVYDSIAYANGYTGHDEPALLFYSNSAGSGNAMTYQLTLPKEPPTLPTQNGSGGTFNFQLHPTFWFGMAICNDQSAPNPGGSSVGQNVLCKPDSDANIYNSSDPTKSDYIGSHPGTAFMEMQIYPPGWAPFQAGGISCDAHQWCAALVIWSLAENMNTGKVLNTRCSSIIGGIEYPNFAFITKNGSAQAPANPVEATGATFTPDASKDLFMNSGDALTISFGDSPHGLVVTMADHTNGTTGSMTASATNGFGEVQFAPTGSTCNNIPYDFHPMYSTSSTETRVPWAAHSYNVSFSDEIGHFEYCNSVIPSGSCRIAGVSEPNGKTDGDDDFCFQASASLLVQVSGCTDSDGDFDGVPYRNTWPGTGSTPSQDAALHPTSLLLSSPLTNGSNYAQAAFEADLPRIERSDFGGTCNGATGANCVNPPPGAAFYPIYTTGTSGTGCVWQLGGPNILGTTNTFGGTSATEYGDQPLQLAYPSVGGPVFIYEDFRNILPSNPCPGS
jgi:hypothetical protein